MPSKMSKDERAAYMRDYRARKKQSSDGAGAAQPAVVLPDDPQPGPIASFDEARAAFAEATADLTEEEASARIGAIVAEVRAARPPFLAAPDDDCLACGHDHQSYHLAGACTYPVGRRQACACPVFVPTF